MQVKMEPMGVSYVGKGSSHQEKYHAYVGPENFQILVD